MYFNDPVIFHKETLPYTEIKHQIGIYQISLITKLTIYYYNEPAYKTTHINQKREGERDRGREKKKREREKKRERPEKNLKRSKQ